MADNTICLKQVSELLGMKFFIPNYQRGYRWTQQQAKDLLNDIEEFRLKNSGGFYCLQPLVVKESLENPDEFKRELSANNDDDLLRSVRSAISNHTRWEVIDGQQRLTTMFILLSYLGLKQEDLYSVNYETRRDSSNFLEELSNNSTDNQLAENVDYYHMSLVKKTIEEWVNNKQNEYNNKINLAKNEDEAEYKRIYENFQKKYLDTILNRVQFIWYEAVDEDPIKVFTRLNIGKIKLTNAELIKALFLNQSNFEKNDQYLKLRQLEIANEWDRIEYTLQNDEFWLFLNPKFYVLPTRIDFIFNLICELDSLKLFRKEDEKEIDIDAKQKKIGTDEYKTFRYFDEYFHREVDNAKKSGKTTQSSTTKIDACWKEVKKYFQIFQEWFNDLELYHYIGYLIAIRNDNSRELIKDLITVWDYDSIPTKKDLKNNIYSKKDFINYLKGRIKDNLKNAYAASKKNESTFTFALDKQFAYEDDNQSKLPQKTTCKPILLLHNIQTIVNQNKQLTENDKYKLPVFYKFPFHLYKLENWDVEHIDSNTTNDLTKAKDQRVWLQEVLYENIISDQKIVDRIKELLKSNDKDLQEQFNDIWEQANKAIEDTITQEETLTQKEKNQIWNFCLLDAGTNRGYGNAIFPAKRRKIIAKDQGKTYSYDDNGNVVNIEKGVIAFVPPVTKNVFLKYFSTSKAQFFIWGKFDAKAYRQNIAETLEKFGVIETSESTNSKDKSNENK